MRIAISGTYSAGKTTTSIALAHFTGVPRTHAKTMREILPEAIPGKRLEDCSIPDLFQLGMIRYAERAVHESHMPPSFISDGSSIHEWVYGRVRTLVGIHPSDANETPTDQSDEMYFFSQVIDSIGAVTKRHAKKSYDVFIHLPVEFDLVTDGHRPVSERFRNLSDELLLQTLVDLDIPHYIVGGTLEERLGTIVELLKLPQVTTVTEAIIQMEKDVASLNTTDEIEREADE